MSPQSVLKKVLVAFNGELVINGEAPAQQPSQPSLHSGQKKVLVVFYMACMENLYNA